MRLMRGEGGGASVLACLYCGAEQEMRPPFAVAYCHCRSLEPAPAVGRAPALARVGRTA